MLKQFRYVSLLSLAVSAAAPCYAGSATEVKNIVIVHGALIDGSGWRAVSDRLTRKGYHVTIVQEPLTSLPDDVAATKRILDLQVGRSILVGQSYGGMVITEAGRADNVAGLVFVSAFLPEKGESVAKLQQSNPVPNTPKDAIKATSDGYLYADPSTLVNFLAADLPKGDAEFIARSQVLSSAQIFGGEVGEPAWKSKPSWTVVATQDHAINPDLERSMAKRAGSKVIELKASHFVYQSKPEDVTRVILDAAKTVSSQ